MELGFKAGAGAARVDHAGHRWMSGMVRERELCAAPRGDWQYPDLLQAGMVLGCRGLRQSPNSVRKSCQITIERLATDRWRLRAATIGSERNESHSKQ
jgi:hypothetical protein